MMDDYTVVDQLKERIPFHELGQKAADLPQRLRGDDGRRLPHHGAGAQLRRQPAADRSDGRGDPLRRRRRGEALRDREPRRGDPGLPGHPGPGSAGGGPMSSTRGAAKRPPSYFSTVTNGRRALDIAALATLFVL